MTSSPDVYQATDGAAYEVFLGRRSRRLAEKLLDFAAFADDGALLDVGCGTGSLTGAIAARWPQRRIVGVDFSEAFLEFARSRELGKAVVLSTAMPPRCPMPTRLSPARQRSSCSISSPTATLPSPRCGG